MLYIFNRAKTQTCPKISAQYMTRFYDNYIISSYLKIPKTNILLINTILTDNQGYQIGSFVYYNDLSKNQDNIINAIKPDFTIRQMKYIEQTNKILAISYYQAIIANPYTLQAEQKVVLQMIKSVDLIKDSNYALISSTICKGYIFNIVNLQQVTSFDVCQYGTSPLSQNIFSKAFKLQNNLSFIVILDDQLGIQTWSFNTTSTEIQFNGYLPQPGKIALFYLNKYYIYFKVFNSSYFDIDIHDKYDILFTIGSNYQINTFQILNQNNIFEYQQLSSIYPVNSNKLSLANIKYIKQLTSLGYKQSLYFSDQFVIYRLDFEFILDPIIKNVKQINFINFNNPAQSITTGKLYTYWYYLEEKQLILMPVYSLYYQGQTFTCSYSYVQNTFQNNQYYLNTGFTKLYEVYYNQAKYYVTAQSTKLYVAKDSVSGPIVEQQYLIYFVKQYPNSFIKVQNCPLCFITLIQNYAIQFNQVLWNQQSCWTDLRYQFQLSLDDVNQNSDAYYDGKQSIWVLFGLPFKYFNENFLFVIIDPCSRLFKTLVSTNQDDNINKTCYALYSQPNQLIIGLDVFGNVYGWNSQKIDQFLFKKTITKYQCFNSGIGKLYNNGTNIYLIAVCEDYQVISFNVMNGDTQILDKLNSKPNHINSFEDSQLLGIGDRDTSKIYLYKFDLQTGLFTLFMNFLNNQNKDKSINLTFYPQTQLLWIQYQYSNIYIPLGSCLQNVNNCLNCSMDFYFQTNELQLSDQSYGQGTIDSPFTTSRGLIQAFLQMQYYSQLVFGIKTIQANFYIDPTNMMTIYQDLFMVSNANITNLRIQSTNPLAQAQISVLNWLIFSNMQQINLENILILYKIQDNSPQQCGMQFDSIIQSIQNISFNNHFEIAFSSISQSQQAMLYNISCFNDQNYQPSISATSPYAGCVSFNDINNLQLNIFNSSFITAVDNSIIEIINQNYENNLINLTNIQIQNSFFQQQSVNSYVNPIYISSDYYSNISISFSNFHNNTLNGLLNSQTYSTTGIQIINSLGDIYLLNSTFNNSKSNSFYNYLYFQSKNVFINYNNFSQSSFDFSDKTTLFIQEGGCIRIKSNYILIQSSQFSQSTSNIGSFLYIESLSQLLQVGVYNSSFQQGYSSNDGAAFFINSQNTQFDIKIEYSNFTDIYALSENSNVISIEQNSPQIKQNQLSQITLTQLYTQNILGFINSSFLKVSNAQVIIQRMQSTKSNSLQLPGQLSGYFNQISQLTIFDIQNCNANLLDCQYFSLQSSASSSYPLLIKSINSQIQVKNTDTYLSQFSQSLIDINQGQLVIINSKFYNLTQTSYSSRIIEQASSSQLDYQMNSLIKLTSGNLQVLDHSIFNYIDCRTNCYGSSIFLNYSSFVIQDSYFMNSKAQNGGAISIFGLNSSTNMINNTNFKYNEVTNNGGALYFQVYEKDIFEVNIIESLFSENKALQGYGGGFYIISQSTNSDSQQIVLQDCQILQNRAKVGGGIYNQGINPFVNSKSLIENNLATSFGDDKFSYPSYLELINLSSFNTENKEQTIIINSFKSGGRLPEFVFELRDSSKKAIYQIDGQQILASIQISNKTSQKDKYYFRGNQQTNMQSKENKFYFSQIDLIGIPGSNSFIEFTSDAIKNYNNFTHQFESNYSFIVQVNFRNCQYGEYINQYNNYQECQTCDDGKYTLDYTACYDCPIGGICQEGIILLEQGYWRDQQYSENIIYCANREQNCVGNSYGNQICVIGNIGPLCEECDIFGEYWKESYTRKNKYECTLCKEIKNDSWKLGLSIIWILFSIIITVKSDKKNQLSRVLQHAFFKKYQNKTNSNKQFNYLYQSQSKFYIKILTNYIQIISSAFAFNINLNQEILQIPHYLGAPVSTSVDYFDCILKDSTLDIPIIYQKLIILLISPILVMMVYLAYEAINQKLVQKYKKFYYYSIYCALIFLFIYIQPDLVFQMISLLSCRQIGQTKYILANMNYECSTETYNFYSLILVIPSLIVWVIIFPLILFLQIYISKKRHTLQNIQVNLKYGFVFQEYKEYAYYWEFVKIVQKTGIIIILNFYSQALTVKGILIYLIILFYEHLAKKVKPYQIDQLNQIDIYSSKVCSLSILLCIFISNNQYYYFQVSCFIIIIAINLIFVLSIGIKIIKHKLNQFNDIFEKLLIKFPQMQRYIKFNFSKKKMNPQLKQKWKKLLTTYLNLNLSQRQNLFNSFRQQKESNQEEVEINKNCLLDTPQYQFSPNMFQINEQSEILLPNALSPICEAQYIIPQENNNLNDIDLRTNNYFKKNQLIIDQKEIQLSEFKQTQQTQTNKQNPFSQNNKLLQLQADNDEIVEQISQDEQNETNQNC
ncbi:hypothetical protein ABPG74_018205 [Tetrahymena malaccensis]